MYCGKNVGATFGRQWGKPPLSYIGKIINAEIAKISDVYKNVVIEKYVIMPNHIHTIILLEADIGLGLNDQLKKLEFLKINKDA